MEESNKIEYTYAVEDLDQIIEDINNGIIPTIPDDMMMEVRIRQKEVESEIMDEDLDIDDEVLARHKEIVRKKVEENRHRASQVKDRIIPLTPKEKETLRLGMETSIVRNNPNSIYHMDDTVLGISQQKRKILEKLSHIRNIYFNQVDFVNAMKIIREAIDYSLEHDYPWMTKGEAIKAYNEGKIAFTYCRIPKLMIDHRTTITDPAILSGIMDGSVELRQKDDEETKRKRREKARQPYKAVDMDYHTDSNFETDQMIAMSKQGFDTPMGVVIQANSHKYNRFSLPPSSRFAMQNEKKNQNPMLAQQLENFDWNQDDAAQRYFELINHKKYQLSDLIKDVVSANKKAGITLNKSFGEQMSKFMYQFAHYMDENPYGNVDDVSKLSNSFNVNQEALEIENRIMGLIKANNPNI